MSYASTVITVISFALSPHPASSTKMASITLLRSVENSQVAIRSGRKPITLLKIRDYFT
jgi:hypothetical protein